MGGAGRGLLKWIVGGIRNAARGAAPAAAPAARMAPVTRSAARSATSGARRSAGGAAAAAPATPSAKRGTLFLGSLGKPGRARDVARRVPQAIRSTPGGLLGIGALGAGGAALYNRFLAPEPDEAGRQAALELLSQQMGGDAQQEAYDAYMAPFIQEVTPDPAYEAYVRDMAAQNQNVLQQYAQGIAPSIEQAYGARAGESAAAADALREIAGLTGESISGISEAGAQAMEDQLYGGGMDVSDVSGLTPLPSYLADAPAIARAEGQSAAQSALRQLTGEADVLSDAAALAERMGPAYAREMADQIALEQMRTQRQADAMLAEDFFRRRAAAEDVQRQAQLNWADVSAESRLGDVTARAQAEAVVNNLIATNPEVLQRYYADWAARDEANWTAAGRDFVEYVATKAAGEGLA